MEYLQIGRHSKKYSASLRIFCLTVHFYSPKAYEYIRQFFHLHLPCIRTIRNWYSAIDGSPGFTECAFSALREKAEESNARGEPLVVNLSHDDMSIRKHSQWSAEQKQFLGHINAGNPVDYREKSCSPLAKEANVLMVSGIGKEFKMPIGYFLSVGLCAQERAAILNEAMLKLGNVGILVGSITNDGNRANISVAKILGADYNGGKPYFMNPFNKKYKVYLILDPPHMIKLARNCVGNKKTIYDSDNNEIKWKFFEDLVSFQTLQNVNLGNKLTKSHIEYQANKMNVRLAAETLSNSTAASMEYLNTAMKEKQFLKSEATVKYIRTFNNLFDIMNSKAKHCDENYKQPMSEENINEIESYFKSAQMYI